MVRGCGAEDECGLWQMDDREPWGSRQKSPEPLQELVSRSTMATEESVKCSESKSIKYLTVREQEESWDRIFYYCIKAEIQRVLRYKGQVC